jgi:hypothetical protein
MILHNRDTVYRDTVAMAMAYIEISIDQDFTAFTAVAIQAKTISNIANQCRMLACIIRSVQAARHIVIMINIGVLRMTITTVLNFMCRCIKTVGIKCIEYARTADQYADRPKACAGWFGSNDWIFRQPPQTIGALSIALGLPSNARAGSF